MFHLLYIWRNCIWKVSKAAVLGKLGPRPGPVVLRPGGYRASGRLDRAGYPAWLLYTLLLRKQFQLFHRNMLNLEVLLGLILQKLGLLKLGKSCWEMTLAWTPGWQKNLFYHSSRLKDLFHFQYGEICAKMMWIQMLTWSQPLNPYFQPVSKVLFRRSFAQLFNVVPELLVAGTLVTLHAVAMVMDIACNCSIHIFKHHPGTRAVLMGDGVTVTIAGWLCLSGQGRDAWTRGLGFNK